MPKEDKTGHEPVKDAFEMSEEEFEDELTNAPSEYPDDKDEAVDKDRGDSEQIAAQQPKEGEDPPPEPADATPAPTKPKPAETKEAGGDTPPVPPPEAEQFVDIKHNGQIHRVTVQKAIELAQKGFDYDHKVGPHSRIAKLIDADPNIAKMVDDYAREQVLGPKEETPPDELQLKPLKDYESTEDWLRDNVEAINAKRGSDTDQGSGNIMQDANRLQTVLQGRDPEHYHEVAPRLEEFSAGLTVERYLTVSNDLPELLKFYDEVKAQVVVPAETSQETTDPPEPTVKVPTPATPNFRAKPGGGDPQRKAENPDYAWNMSNEDFDAELQEAKGY